MHRMHRINSYLLPILSILFIDVKLLRFSFVRVNPVLSAINCFGLPAQSALLAHQFFPSVGGAAGAAAGCVTGAWVISQATRQVVLPVGLNPIASRRCDMSARWAAP